MRAHLHGHRVAVRVAHAGEQPLQVGRLGRGVLRLLPHVSDADAHRADDPRALARHTRDVFHEVGRGGLAVRAGDAHERDARRRMVVEVRGGDGHGLARVLHHDLGHVGGVGQIHLALDHEHLRPAIDGVLRERVSVGREAHNAEERIARLHPVAAVGDAAHLVVGVSDDGAVYAREQFRARLSHGVSLTPDRCRNGRWLLSLYP